MAHAPDLDPAAAGDRELFTAPELARELGITPRALRFYETKGLIEPRRVGSRRAYGRRDRARLSLILRGKRLGFSLASIREYLELYDADRSQTEQIRLLHGKVRDRIRELELQQEALELTLAELKAIRAETEATLASRECDGSHPGTPADPASD